MAIITRRGSPAFTELPASTITWPSNQSFNKYHIYQLFTYLQINKIKIIYTESIDHKKYLQTKKFNLELRKQSL